MGFYAYRSHLSGWKGGLLMSLRCAALTEEVSALGTASLLRSSNGQAYPVLLQHLPNRQRRLLRAYVIALRVHVDSCQGTWPR